MLPREIFEIRSPEMPGNTSNFNNHREVAYSFCLDSYIFQMPTYVLNRSNLNSFPVNII